MKLFLAILFGVGLLLVSGAGLAQNSNMMNGGMWNAGWMGGYGGTWVPILLVIVVVAVVAWMLGRKGK
jgi:uncharacterized membrane protein